jgi:hypothetical protein
VLEADTTPMYPCRTVAAQGHRGAVSRRPDLPPDVWTCCRGRRGRADYVFNAAGRQSEDVEGLLGLSHSPVADGADWGAAAWLWGISVALVRLSAVALDRRDGGA